MIELYYWPTPNGHKITMMLEEAGLDYRIVPVDIGAGDQFRPAFLKIAPNNRMPAIVDQQPADGDGPLSVFESGAILQYLGEKTGCFFPTGGRSRWQVLEWLNWQMGGLGPMLGQNHHFRRYAPETIPYAVDRYERETTRLYRVLDRRLQGRAFIVDDYSIADMACYPWIVPWKTQGQVLDDFPSLRSWFERIGQRPATRRAYALAEHFDQPDGMTDAMRENLFGQTDTTPGSSQ